MSGISTTSHRVEVIDVLRGFALLGILIVHVSGEFAGWSTTYINPNNPGLLHTAGVDSAVNFIVGLFFTNKSRALFGFLFGVGFYFQLGKANRSGYSIERRFAKRMGFLFLIGVANAYLIWAGDILRLYAICGMLLLLVYKWKSKTLFVTACLCTVLIPAMSAAIHYYVPFTVLDDNAKRFMYWGYAGENITNLLRANLLRDAAVNLDPYSTGTYFFPIWGNFLFGFWAAQTGLIQKLSDNKKRLLIYLLISGITGILLSNNAVRLTTKLLHTDENKIDIIWRSALSLPAAYSIEATAFFLLCVLVYLYQFTYFRYGLSFFTFAGRMTLTNYIMQSVFAVVFFFGVGFGFISHFGAFTALCIGLLFYIFQLIYSYVWLQFFTSGPIEYIWRSMIEGKWQTIRKQKIIAA